MESSEADVPMPAPPKKTTRTHRRDPLIGAVLDGRYEVKKLIARGGMGRIYAGEQSALGRDVALKVMDLGYSEELDPDFQKRFFLEASTVAQLNHPNTIRVFDYGADGDICYIAMELVVGHTLLQAIHQDAPFEASRILHIARQICGSLGEAHRKGIIHRDLKPSNVLLTQHGDVEDFAKVLDFGLVKLLREDAQEITRSGLFLGSPNYMSPEQIRATGVDQRSDLYSLGVILFMALTGKSPFKRNTSINVLLAQLEEPPPALVDVVPDTDASPAMQWAVMTCLEKKPGDRFATVDELNKAFKACEAELRGDLTGPLWLRLEAGLVVVDTVPPGRDAYAIHGLQRPGAGMRSELPTVETPNPSGFGGGHSLPPAGGSSRQSVASSWGDASQSGRADAHSGPSLAGRVSSLGKTPSVSGPATSRHSGPATGDRSGPSAVGPNTRGTRRRRRKKKQPRWPLLGLLALGGVLAVVLVVVASQQEPAPIVEPDPVLPEAVRLFSEPAGASVFKDGTFLGTTPLDLTIPEDESWSVTITVPGHLEKTVLVPPGIGSRRVQLAAVPAEPPPDVTPAPRATRPRTTPKVAPKVVAPPVPAEEPKEVVAEPATPAPEPPKEEPTAEEAPTDGEIRKVSETRDPWGE